jgi:hypothetical protein
MYEHHAQILIIFTPSVERLETRDKLAQHHVETTKNYIPWFVLASRTSKKSDTHFDTGLTCGNNLDDCVRTATANQEEIRRRRTVQLRNSWPELQRNRETRP